MGFLSDVLSGNLSGAVSDIGKTISNPAGAIQQDETSLSDYVTNPSGTALDAVNAAEQLTAAVNPLVAAGLGGAVAALGSATGNKGINAAGKQYLQQAVGDLKALPGDALEAGNASIGGLALTAGLGIQAVGSVTGNRGLNQTGKDITSTTLALGTKAQQNPAQAAALLGAEAGVIATAGGGIPALAGALGNFLNNPSGPTAGSAAEQAGMVSPATAAMSPWYTRLWDWVKEEL